MIDGSILAGRRVLITGGAGGVGRAVAARMVGAGAHILITDRPEADLAGVAAELGRGAPLHDFAADLSTSAGIAALFTAVDEKLGGLDMVIACAGVGSGPLMEMDDAGWRYVLESNLASYVGCTRAAIERIRAAGIDHGMIVLVGSISVHIKAVGESVYNAAKGGVASFAETLRKELMPERIRLTLIEPGAIGSAMQPYSAEERSRFIEEFQMLPPAEVADAILYAATRPRGVDVVTLRIEPLHQKIY
ncbi:SDR family oxidoreductase [Sphingomonas desiccabilis]|uniref:SDR family oxidoreductase n=1 Tax=Sphingomonas desiccabilis TaxID=429134 RepID=A0A4Q2IV41_9SPHN|nr:SDR family oxidoreductase [Sphingomonas desiccabilis]MBB3911135.1 NAD(P)-dependent dehydrogenase (short-subunit alcohol dehydrogenase family) [Sphingomonas desiccabilis]RXZ32059.1 SDR family oxidoreductase [Sphingomonas desiccabilis]